MDSDFLMPKGEVIAPNRLCLIKARALASHLTNDLSIYAKLVECRKNDQNEIVIFDADIEVPQIRKYPIKNKERIAVTFFEKDDRYPEVLALRPDFPLTPHCNLRDIDIPRSLCLYDVPYCNVKSRWTAARFIELIRQWLSLTANGVLHQGDQPLEPLLSGFQGHIVIPYDIIENQQADPERKLYVTRVVSNDDTSFLIASDKKTSQNSPAFIAFVYYCPPREHGIIHKAPQTLADVAAFVGPSDINLIENLRKRLKSSWEKREPGDAFYKCHLSLILVCPKTREGKNEIEVSDVWVFATQNTIETIGAKLDIWDLKDGHICPLISFNTIKNGEDEGVYLLKPLFHLTRKMSAELNGLSDIINSNVVAIGVGALGSQVVMNLARSGYGTWKLIDNDVLMPHNAARHALDYSAIGFNKAYVVSVMAGGLIQNEDIFSYIPADVINPRKHSDALQDAYKNADCILDMSASEVVARHLALDVIAQAKRISLFLNPTGDDLILLSEDSHRNKRLDALEMQYYRAVIHETSLQNHFKPVESRKRYGRSCRDITTTLPQTLVAMYAAIGAQALPKAIETDDAQIIIWRSNSLGNVHRIDIDTTPVVYHETGDWKIITDELFLGKLQELRSEKLPNETGGVLMGFFDLERKNIYLVDTIPSPPDSKEWPLLYIRGCAGLRNQIDEIANKTHNMLEYVGEWHSHPGRNTSPSRDDVLVFSWLTEFMDRDGLPAVMLIAGEGIVSCFVGQISRTENLLALT